LIKKTEKGVRSISGKKNL